MSNELGRRGIAGWRVGDDWLERLGEGSGLLQDVTFQEEHEQIRARLWPWMLKTRVKDRQSLGRRRSGSSRLSP